MEAQKFRPISTASSPAAGSNWVGLTSGALHSCSTSQGQAPIITPVQAALIHKAVIAQCDAQDGLRDGELADPRLCGFHARSLVCRSGQPAGECLTRTGDVADKFYQAVRDPKSGRLILPGSLPGSEPGWGMVPVPMPPAVSEYRFVVYGDFMGIRTRFRSVEGRRRSAPHRHHRCLESRIVQPSRRTASSSSFMDSPIRSCRPKTSINYFESVVARRGRPGEDRRVLPAISRARHGTLHGLAMTLTG